MVEIQTPFASALPYIGTALPTWLNAYDAQRLGAYQLYKDVYWTIGTGLKVQMFGSENTDPMYFPAPRIICNTFNRYLGRDWKPITNPVFGSDSEKTLADQILDDLFARNRMGSQYAANKLDGIIQGDWCWYITANPLKPEGTRIKISALDPSLYFPIEDPEDSFSILGQDIVEEVTIGDKPYVKRQRYLKSEHPNNPFGGGLPGGSISYQVDTFEQQDWEDESKQKVFSGGQNEAPVELTGIIALPVYHIKNHEETGQPYGSSELRGIERLLAGVNGTISDEELGLALEGLGLYKTDGGAPVDDDGNAVPWQIGPGRVLELGVGNEFDRVQGITSVEPFQDHIGLLLDGAYTVTGASDVAQGKVSVEVAESGIALQIRLAPIIESSNLADNALREVHNQMLFDLRTWLAVYEGQNLENIRWISTFGEKMPRNKTERFNQLLQMYTAIPPIVSGGYVRQELRDDGWNIPDDETLFQQIVDEQAAFTEFSDPNAARTGAEAGGTAGTPPAEPPA
jgi:hypothetical protein